MAAPQNTSSQFMYINRKLFQEAGITPPKGFGPDQTIDFQQISDIAAKDRWTWDQVIDAAKKLTKGNQSFAGIGFYRLLFFVPIGVSVPIASILWRTMLDPNAGLINSLLSMFKIPSQPFLISQDQALWCIIAIATWKGISFWMIFLWAGLQDIPQHVLEAAEIDGADRFQRFLFVTLPLLRRPLLFVLVTDTATNFLLFVPMFLLTGGGPAGSTNVMMFEAYKSGFVYGEMGRALAIVVVLLLLVVAVVALQFRLLRRSESER